jgi:hypothetical protein
VSLKNNNKGLNPDLQAIAGDPGGAARHVSQSTGAVSSSEQEIPPEVLRQVAEEVKGSFKRSSHATEVILIDIDPYRLHAFWAVAPETIAVARNKLGVGGEKAPMVLRIFDLSTTNGVAGSAPSFDVEVRGLQSRSYIDIFGRSRRYRAELGLRAPGGDLVVLGKSNVVELPPTSASNTSDYREITVEAHAPPRIDALGPMTETWEQQTEPSAEVASRTPPAKAQVTIPARFPSPPVEKGERKITDPPQSFLELPAEEQARDEPPPTGEGTIETPALELEQALTLSSYALGRQDGEFEVVAELHVYGHADPNRELHLFGRKIPLRPDGSFSIRRILANDPVLIEALLASEDTTDEPGSH